MDDLMQLNVMVADRIYPLRVQESEKEEVLTAVKLVNEKIKEYQRTYDGKDKQDYLAMVLLLFAVEHMRSQAKNAQTDTALQDKLNQLESLLASV
ncbi:MAG: cell division protein ZapA [Chitinophagales bacterium]